MSRSINSDSSAVSVPAALRPATLRGSLALVALAALTAFALRAEAQTPVQSAITVRPIVGALVATGDERDLLKNAVVVGGQASYNLNSNFAVRGSFAWSPSEEKTITPRPKVDLYQYDLGIEGKLDDLTSGSSVTYAAVRRARRRCADVQSPRRSGLERPDQSSGVRRARTRPRSVRRPGRRPSRGPRQRDVVQGPER